MGYEYYFHETYIILGNVPQAQLEILFSQSVISKQIILGTNESEFRLLVDSNLLFKNSNHISIFVVKTYNNYIITNQIS